MTSTVFLESLEQLIAERLLESPAGSYTAALAAKGVVAVAQKVGEEGVELALAGAAQGDAEVVGEAADLVYHLLVLLAVRGVSLATVVAALEQRHRSRLPLV
jgi:phosphoribosyl-ATP pyrophosphohydrolase/phosphoribosyl-AMP cyclohydrolase